MCPLCYLVPSILFQITNDIPTRLSLLLSSILSTITNQQSLPDYLLGAFCSHWDFCSLPHLLQNLNSHQIPSSLQSALICQNFFQSLPNSIISCNLLLTPLVTHFLSMITVLLLALLLSSLTYLTVSNAAVLSVMFSISNYNGKYYPRVCCTKRQFAYLFQVAYHLPSFKVCLFSPQVFHKNCGGIIIIFGD